MTSQLISEDAEARRIWTTSDTWWNINEGDLAKLDISSHHGDHILIAKSYYWLWGCKHDSQ